MLPLCLCLHPSSHAMQAAEKSRFRCAQFAGEVCGVGDGVQHLQPGDRVMGVSRFGSFATCLDAPAMQAIMLLNTKTGTCRVTHATV